MRVKQFLINELIEILLVENFEISDFVIPNLSNTVYDTITYENGSTGTEYRFSFKKNRAYYFRFINHSERLIYCPKICPAAKDIEMEWVGGKVKISLLKEIFLEWLNALKSEIVAQEYYESFFIKKMKPYLFMDEQSKERFSKTEISFIESHFDEIREHLKSLNLKFDQIKGMEIKFDEFVESAKIDKKGKWQDYIIGGLFSAFISLAINPETAMVIYELVKKGIQTNIFKNNLFRIKP